jgi:drug/metabolite transporter (DMT)-like permease
MTSEKTKYFFGAVAVSLSAVLWGFDGIVLTPRLYNLNVSYVVFVLHLFPFLLMNFFLYREYRHLKRFTGSDFLVFALIALFGGALGTMAIVKALFLMDFNHLSVVVLLQKLQPIFAIILAVLLLGEKLGKHFLLWASLAIIGGYFLTFEFGLPDFNSGGNTVMASLLALLAAFSFGSSTVFSKMILGKFSFITSTFYRYGFTSVIMLLIMLGFGDFGQFSATTNENWLFIAIIGLTTGSGTIFLYYFGLKRVKAIMATISELMFPVSAVVFDYVFNQSVFSTVQWISAAVMIFAIVNLNIHRAKQLK